MKKTIKQGLGAAAGVFVGNTIFIPVISNIPLFSSSGIALGLVAGLAAAAIVLVIYSIMALCQSD